MATDFLTFPPGRVNQAALPALTLTGLLTETGVRLFAGTFTSAGGGSVAKVNVTVGTGWAPRAIWFFVAPTDATHADHCYGFCDQAFNQFSSCSATDGTAARTDSSATQAIHYVVSAGTDTLTFVVSSFATGFAYTPSTNAATVVVNYIAMR